MDVFEILNDKRIRKLEARKLIADSISDGTFSLTDFSGRAEELKDRQTATFLEAVESITGQKDSRLDVEYLKFAEKYILSENNSCKREASRIVGNMAHLYPDELGGAVEALIKNTSVSGNVCPLGKRLRACEDNCSGALQKQRPRKHGQGCIRSRAGEWRQESVRQGAQTHQGDLRRS